MAGLEPGNSNERSFAASLEDVIFNGGNEMKRAIVVAALFASFAAPALADEFYVVRNATTHKCTIVNKAPTEKSVTVVSPSGTMYKTRAEAESGMKTIKVCHDE